MFAFNVKDDKSYAKNGWHNFLYSYVAYSVHYCASIDAEALTTYVVVCTHEKLLH
jgi:hypothetical protein